jgi:hypothetical protein
LLTHFDISCAIIGGIYAFYFRAKFPVIAKELAGKHTLHGLEQGTVTDLLALP